MKRKRVLLLITNLTFGGAQRVFYSHSKLLSKNFDVFECVFNNETVNAFPTGNSLISLDVKAGRNLIDKIYRFFQRVVRLKRIKKEYQIDICISHLEGADLVNILSKQNEKVITWVHGSKRHDENIEGILGFIRHRLLIPFTYKRADKVVTVSNAIKDELVEFYRVSSYKIETLYNFFDVEEIQCKASFPIDNRYKMIFESGKILVFSGRLVRQKNPQNLLKWFARFNSNQEYKLVIIGDGELREQLLKLCDELQQSRYSAWSSLPPDNQYGVYFLGFQENPFNLISRSTAFILPSLWEGFPMALGEAMACGVPVISADCPTGPREMLSNTSQNVGLPSFAEYGLLLHVLTETTFKTWNECIRELLNNNDKLAHYAVKSLERANDFSKDKNAQRLITLTESVL